jgi:hypothetical protein
MKSFGIRIRIIILEQFFLRIQDSIISLVEFYFYNSGTWSQN